MKRIDPRNVVLGLWSGLIIALSLIVGGTQLQAQVGSQGASVSVSGKITSVKTQEVSILSPVGPVTVKLNDKTIIRNEVPVKFSDITSGMYVGATAEKQPDGSFRASRLHIFSEDQRGAGEGHRPLSSAPQSALTMTNANVESVEDVAVENIKGRILMLRYKGGEMKVVVPGDILVVKRVLGDRALLAPGKEISVNGTQVGKDAIDASQITVRAPTK